MLDTDSRMAFWELLRRFLGPTTTSTSADVAVLEPEESTAPFTVLLAPLEHDDGGAVTDALGQLPGVVLRTAAVPATIDPGEDMPVSLSLAAKRGRAQVTSAGAHCVLWGVVEDGRVRLWVLPAEPSPEPAGCTAMAGDSVTLPLPLTDTLPLAVALTLVALPLETDIQRSRRLDLLRGPLQAVDALLQGEPPRLPAALKPGAAMVYAAAMGEIGWRAGQRSMLEKAADVIQAALAKAREAADPETGKPGLLDSAQIAAAQARLADLQADLGRQDKDAERLEKAVKLYTRAARYYSYELLPEEHARVIVQKGRACHRLSHMTGKTAWMREAITCYRDASRVWTKRSQPDRWAEMQHGIGTLLGQLGEFTGKKDIFERAVKVLESVLEVWTRTDHPRRWAGLHNNMGACRFAEGKIGSDIPALREALEHFSFALEVYQQMGMTRNIHVTQKNISRVERLINVQEGRG